MTTADWKQVTAYVLGRMEAELPPNLDYHGIHHTRDDVLPAAIRLSSLVQLAPPDAFLLQTAALYHDFGFVIQIADHERVSAELAAQTLPGFRFCDDQIAQIQGMIIATRLPQTPHNLLEELICDADLDSLGREDFFNTSHNLLRELSARGAQIDLKRWYEGQLRFLSSHVYFTAAAEDLRGAGKRNNIAELQRRIVALGEAPVWEIPD